MSDRGLRYVLHHLSGGNSVAVASYLADRCAGAGSTLGRLEADAEAAEAKDLERNRKAEQARERAEEATKRDKAELNAFKSKIVDRYADEVGLRLGLYQAWAGVAIAVAFVSLCKELIFLISLANGGSTK